MVRWRYGLSYQVTDSCAVVEGLTALGVGARTEGLAHVHLTSAIQAILYSNHTRHTVLLFNRRAISFQNVKPYVSKKHCKRWKKSLFSMVEEVVNILSNGVTHFQRISDMYASAKKSVSFNQWFKFLKNRQ